MLISFAVTADHREADLRLCFRICKTLVFSWRGSIVIRPWLRYRTRIDVYETLCPQQMLVHKGGKIKNWGGECRDVTPTNCSLKIFLKRALGGGGGRVGGVRMDVNDELKFL